MSGPNNILLENKYTPELFTLNNGPNIPNMPNILNIPNIYKKINNDIKNNYIKNNYININNYVFIKI